jgi:hypothetical protein
MGKFDEIGLSMVYRALVLSELGSRAHAMAVKGKLANKIFWVGNKISLNLILRTFLNIP